VTASPASLSFVAFYDESTLDSRSVSVSWTGANVAGYAVGTLPGVPALPPWLGVNAAPATASPSTVTFQRNPLLGVAPGSYSTTVRVVTGDANLNPISQVDIPVSLEVVPAPTVTPTALSMTWVESEQPAAQQLTVTRAENVQIVSATPDVPWLGASVAGDLVTVAPTAAAAAVRPGPHAASVRVVFSRPGGATAHADVPVSASVAYALGGPAMSVIELEVNAATEAAQLLNRTSTLATATQAPVQFDATSNVAWLTSGSGMTTGSPDNLVMNLQANEIRALPHGEHDGMLTITPTTPNISSVQIPVRLKLNLPEVRVVMPVAFTDTVTSDYVVVHGRGLTQPDIDLEVAGAAPQSITVVDDRTVHLVPGAHAAGDYAVTVTNALGFDRGSANLRVTEPPAYAAASLDVPVGLQSRVVSSPVNRAVFTHLCYFCQVTPAGVPSTLHRFAYDSGTGQWTHSDRLVPSLYDIALTPDESKLIILTSGQLQLADPSTMLAEAEDTFDLPSFAGGTTHQLAVAGDGLVFIGDSTQVFSLRSRTFVSAPSGYVLGRAPAASADGSRVLLPFGGGAAQIYTPATDAITTTSVVAADPRASLSRHAAAAFSGGTVLDADLSERGTLALPWGALSPDGTRLYYADLDTSDVRVFDVTADAPFGEELPAIDVPGVPNASVARLAVDPRGQHVFYVTEQKFVVIPLP
jgi:hypothetical protein